MHPTRRRANPIYHEIVLATRPKSEPVGKVNQNGTGKRQTLTAGRKTDSSRRIDRIAGVGATAWLKTRSWQE
jgi:hypothetical protein